ncbi:restriction endonuclease subunit S [Staphylococcus epidermidis]|uniref:restriction endonuclease subunit S n=2 Tax=Staphylococcus epidermidis TaxID=1282 RepID=UPI000735AE44|nr:restriction endonuclease subunit S [Staphylococcus epidermidis]MCG1076697.1 restriction endonuclease subunit S [Staphylococcus epidermidis]MCG1137538.1 restriction endonuclease subunit S [Staphylococcus epidermidis]MCG1360223.1 restriction endonuclease subunit S [Staphylococcus epidermidis]MCG1384528.1 restriction endonuclease subunit S [Staphylococcus epidermidis]MCG1409519.1 restriction endonuclease subunit S [Staphylococcus epidermidis]
MEFNKYRLKELAKYKNERINTNQLTTSNYISTENLLPNKQGKQKANKLPSSKTVKKYTETDILVSNIRPYFKKIWQADNIGGISNDVLNITSSNEKISNDYLYYYLSQDKFFQYMTQTSKGTKMPRGDKEAIMEFEIQVPKNVKYQNFISNLGKFLDNKIEINNKIIANLEKLSQTLFKRWFVDFEFPDEDGNPYKSSGGEMINSELGEMPKNWKVNKLKEFTKKISSGGTPSRKVKDYWEYGEIMWLKTKEVKEKMIVTTEENITDLGLLKSSAKIINENSTVIAMYGATAGQIAYLGCKMATNQACCTIESEYPDFIYNYFVYNANYIKTLSSGSAQQNLNKKIIEDLKLLVPSLKVLNHYESSVNSNTSLIKSLTLSNLKLQELRDTLLPKLMSGELEISDDIEVNTDELSI